MRLDTRIQNFLATKEVVVLATIGPDGSPRATPMWFVATPEAIFMISLSDTHKVRDLSRDPRLAVVAETTTSERAISGVTVRGRAEFLPESPERIAIAGRFLDKYHPRLERLWGGRVMPPDRVMFRIVPERVRSWGLA